MIGKIVFKNEADIPFIAVPLKKNKDNDYPLLPETFLEFKLNDPKKFDKYCYSDFMEEINKACDIICDMYETEEIFPDKLPSAIAIVSKYLKNKKFADIRDYLEKTKEFMEKAIELDTALIFHF